MPIRALLLLAIIITCAVFSGCTAATPKEQANGRFMEMKSVITSDVVDSVVVNGRMGNGRARSDQNPKLVEKFVEALTAAKLIGPYDSGESALLTSTRDAEITFVFHDQSTLVLEYYHGFGMTISGADQRSTGGGSGTFYAPQWRIFLVNRELEKLTVELPSG